MTVQEKTSLFLDIVNNEELITKLSNASSKEEMIDIFSQNGLDMNLDEIDGFIKTMNSKEVDTMNEEELDSVSGGLAVDALWVFSQAAKGIKAVAKKCWNFGKWLADKGY